MRVAVAGQAIRGLLSVPVRLMALETYRDLAVFIMAGGAGDLGIMLGVRLLQHLQYSFV